MIRINGAAGTTSFEHTNRTFFTITPDGKIELGLDLSADEATARVAEMLAERFSRLHERQAEEIRNLQAEVGRLRLGIEKGSRRVLTVRRSEADGSLWARFPDKMTDGQFEEISPQSVAVAVDEIALTTAKSIIETVRSKDAERFDEGWLTASVQVAVIDAIYKSNGWKR